MPTAGEMILAGDLASAIHQYERNGRGAAGWDAAAEWLNQRHPGTNPRSIQAVLTQARDTVGIGNRYRQGNPDYRPPGDAVPDVRGLEARALAGGQGPPAGERQSKYFYVFTVRMMPQGYTGNVGPVYHNVREFDKILTRQEFETIVMQYAADFNREFQETVDGGTKKDKLAPEIRLGGVYRGF